MRKIIAHQQPLVETSIEHEHAKELKLIDELLSSCPEIVALLHGDLVYGLKADDRGRPGMMSAEQVLKVLLIKQMNGFSFRVLRFHLEDSRTYRTFCRFGIFEDIPSVATIQRDIKKLRPETLEAINLKLLQLAADLNIEKGRTIRVDCTVVESNIGAPTDSRLLSDCVRKLCHFTGKAREIFHLQVCDHSRAARRQALSILNAKNKDVRNGHYRHLLKLAAKVVEDSRRVSASLNRIMSGSRRHHTMASKLSGELEHYIPLAERVIDQARRRVLYDEHVPANEKLVSIFEPHTDIIIKDRRETYYGHKIVISNGASGLFTDLVIEQGNPADSTLATKMVARQQKVYGRMPRQVSFDGGFASKDNLAAIKQLGVSDVAFAKKRGLEIEAMAKSTWVYKRLRDFRAGIEGMISYLKRCFGLSKCNWRGFQSFKAYAWSSVLAANCLLLARRLLE